MLLGRAGSFYPAPCCCRSVQLLPIHLGPLLSAPMVPQTAVQGWQLTAWWSQATVLLVCWHGAEARSPRQQALRQATTVWGPLQGLRCRRRAPAWPPLCCPAPRSQARPWQLNGEAAWPHCQDALVLMLHGFIVQLRHPKGTSAYHRRWKWAGDKTVQEPLEGIFLACRLLCQPLGADSP